MVADRWPETLSLASTAAALSNTRCRRLLPAGRLHQHRHDSTSVHTINCPAIDSIDIET